MMDMMQNKNLNGYQKTGEKNNLKASNLKAHFIKFNKQRLLKSYIDRDKYLRPVANCCW